jgi:hypothetical protein
MIYVDFQFLINSLGGYDEVVKLSDSLGMDLTVLANSQGSLVGENRVKLSNFEIWCTNYDGYYYPDINIYFYKEPSSRYLTRLLCENVGLRETEDQAMDRVKTWFHDKVIPTYLTNLFS